MIRTGDCIEVMAGMPADSVDAVVTDPPYGLEFMGKAWDAFKATGSSSLLHSPKDEGRTFTNESGHMWDNTKALPRLSAGTPFQAWCEAWGREALRVTKPGGYLLAFGGGRTHHRLVCGLEDAGWLIRDELTWVYASGFPKGKANLKPAHEPIVLARKPGPLRALNIEECRIGTGADKDDQRWYEWQRGESVLDQASGMYQPGKTPPRPPQTLGRWPSNLLLSDPELFDVANPGVVGSGAVTTTSQPGTTAKVAKFSGDVYGESSTPQIEWGYGDSGGYSRFFIVPKADRADREPVLRGQLPEKAFGQSGGAQAAIARGEEYQQANASTGLNRVKYRVNDHATVKPTDLMRHLVRLVTPQGGTVLDCFLGSGSTAIACELEGFPWIGIEQDAGYVAIAEARLNGVQRGMGLVS